MVVTCLSTVRVEQTSVEEQAIWLEVIALLKHIVFILIIGVVPFGCSDSRQDTDGDSKPGASTRETKSSPEQSSAASTVDSRKFHGPRDVIVDGRLTVDVMEIAVPPRASELARRMKQAVRENPDWWLEHVKKAQPGKSLPYDPRLGISEVEYDEFLVLRKKMTMQKVTEATLTITAKGQDVYILDGGQALADLTGIEIDLNKDLVRTPFGILSERSEINASEDSALGAWDGIQWKLVDPDPSGITGTVAKLAVGKLKRSGRCVIYYDVRKISLDGKARISYVLNFDVPLEKQHGAKSNDQAVNPSGR